MGHSLDPTQLMCGEGKDMLPGHEGRMSGYFGRARGLGHSTNVQSLWMRVPNWALCAEGGGLTCRVTRCWSAGLRVRLRKCADVGADACAGSLCSLMTYHSMLGVLR